MCLDVIYTSLFDKMSYIQKGDKLSVELPDCCVLGYCGTVKCGGNCNDSGMK